MWDSKKRDEHERLYRRQSGAEDDGGVSGQLAWLERERLCDAGGLRRGGNAGADRRGRSASGALSPARARTAESRPSRRRVRRRHPHSFRYVSLGKPGRHQPREIQTASRRHPRALHGGGRHEEEGLSACLRFCKSGGQPLPLRARAVAARFAGASPPRGRRRIRQRRAACLHGIEERHEGHLHRLSRQLLRLPEGGPADFPLQRVRDSRKRHRCEDRYALRQVQVLPCLEASFRG